MPPITKENMMSYKLKLSRFVTMSFYIAKELQ